MGHVSPLLRSTTLTGVLELLFLEQGPWTAEELAAQSGSAYATVTKEVRRLEEAGLLTVKVTGRQKQLAPNRADPTARALARVLQAARDAGDPMGRPERGKKATRKKNKRER